MSVEGPQVRDTFEALEDLNSHQYFAVALDDGKIANDGEEARGILLNNPKTNEFGTVATKGVSKFRAGKALTKGDKLTVTTSGWFTTGDSGYFIVGECRNTVTSGSIGTGDFLFQTAPYLSV